MSFKNNYYAFFIFIIVLTSAVSLSENPQIQPLRPIEEIHSEALKSSPPIEKGNFMKPDFVELAVWDPELKFDIRYATSDKFIGTAVYDEPRAFLLRPAAEALRRVDRSLRTQDFGLLVFDAYRPWFVTKIFWDATPNEMHPYVSDPAFGSRHNRGCAVDLTLVDLKTGKALPMPTDFDEFSKRAWPDYEGGTLEQRRNRNVLIRAMESEGFTVLPTEWWHFDYKEWRNYQLLNVSFSSLPNNQ